MHEFDIAIVGMAGRFPGASDIDSLWSGLREGRELITQFDREELLGAGEPAATVDRPDYVGARGLLADADLFDAAFFGFSPREAEVMDPQHRLFLECAWQSLEDAGCDPARHDGPVGVFAGVGMNTYLLRNVLKDEGLVASMGDFQIMALNDKDTLPSRVSYKLDLRGPSVDIQTSCSTGLVAVSMACDSLNSFGCDLALAGSVAVKFPQVAGYTYVSGGITSPDGHCRAFDADAQGTVGGGGVGVVVLKRLADALADGDVIRAVVRGSAVNNDGNRKISYAAPSINGQAEVVAAALSQADVAPDTIGYVETHGTGTPIGDPIEIEALTRAFRAGTDRVGYCALGSVKTNIGHLDAASGMAGLIKTVCALVAGEIPASLHYKRPNPEIAFESSPFFVASVRQPWPLTDGPRRAGVSSFGVGGTNAHVVLEQAPPVQPASASVAPELLLFSARQPGSLDAVLGRFGDWLSSAPPDVRLADVAHTLHRGRSALPERAAFVCRDRDEATQALASLSAPRAHSRGDLLRGRASDNGAPDVVLLFPGQGTQRVAPAPELYRLAPSYRDALDECCEILRAEHGLDLRSHLFPAAGTDPAQAREALRQTQLAQPAVFATNYALACVWRSWALNPTAMIGHSVGEYVAACLAGVMSLEDALRVVAVRGRLVGEFPTGAMLSVRLPEIDLPGALGGLWPDLALAAVNGPNSTVLAGPDDRIDEAERLLQGADVLCRRLETSHAFHSLALRPAADALERELRKISLNSPAIEVLSTVTGSVLSDDEARDPRYWAQQLVSPVRFHAAATRAQATHPGASWVEAGLGRTLTTFVRPVLQGDPAASATSTLPEQDGGADLEDVLGAVGRLWTRGHDLDLTDVYGDRARRKVRLPTYPFDRQRFWVEAPDAESGGRPAGEPTKDPDVGRWFSTAGWGQAQIGPATHVDRDWLVLDDEQGVAVTVTATRNRVLVRAGEEFGRTGPRDFVLRPDQPEDYRTLLAALRQDGITPTAVLHAFGLRAAAPEARGDKTEVLGLLGLARALAEEPPEADAGPLPVWVLTEGVFDVLPTDSIAPGAATVLGAALVLPQEHAWLRCSLVDLPAGAGDDRETMALLTNETAGEVQAATVALRAGRRWTRAYEPLVLPAGPARPGDVGGVATIFGGLGQFGRRAAALLAQLGCPRIALVDLATPDEQAGRDLAAVEALGAEVLVLTADISDESQVHEAVAQVTGRWGPIECVIHAAGPPERLAATGDVDEEELAVQFKTKVDGLTAIDRVLARLPAAPRTALIASSLASHLGGPGHAAYAAATSYADAFARRPSRVPWQSVGFDTWDLDDAQAAAPRSGHTRTAMIPTETTEVLRRLLLHGTALREVVVSTTDLPARVARWAAPATANTAGAARRPVSPHQRPTLSSEHVAPRSQLESELTALWEEMLGVDGIGAHDSFFELGGDSLLATRVVSAIRSRFDVDLPLRQLFDNPTPAQLADLIDEERADGDDLAAVRDLLEQLDALPEDEAREHLRRAGFPAT